MKVFLVVNMERKNSNLEEELEELIELECLANEYTGKRMEDYDYSPNLRILENRYNTKDLKLISHYKTQELIGDLKNSDCFLENVSNFAEKN